MNITCISKFSVQIFSNPLSFSVSLILKRGVDMILVRGSRLAKGTVELITFLTSDSLIYLVRCLVVDLIDAIGTIGFAVPMSYLNFQSL